MRVLYLSYNGLAEALGASQILPYRRSLTAHGHSFSIVSFEKARGEATLSEDEVIQLLPAGARWTPLRYHRRPTVPATAWDITQGVLRGLMQGPFDLVHARGTIPALMAFTIGRMRGKPWLFDVRGLMAQEYVDAGRWPARGLLARLTARTESQLVGQADGLVFLTRRAAASARATYRLPAARSK